MRSKFATLLMAFSLLSPAALFASGKKGAGPATAIISSQSHMKKSHHSKKHSKTKKSKKSKKSKRTKPTKKG